MRVVSARDRKKFARRTLMRNMGAGALVGAMFVLALILWVGFTFLGIWLIVVNGMDIHDNGMNFWNLFWLIFGVVMVIGMAINRGGRK